MRREMSKQPGCVRGNEPAGGPRRGRRLRGMASALMLGTALPLAGPLAAPAVAQTTGQAVAFDIPAQPLASAIIEFANATGYQVLVDDRVAAGRTSAPVQSMMTPRAALARMLEGTGLVYEFVNRRTVSLSALPDVATTSETGVLLDPIYVEGETAWGPVDGVVARRSATGTKTDTPLVNVPQTVNVVTADQIKAQGADSVTEALTYTPGVVAQYSDNDVRHDWLTIRGFRPDRYLDGLRLPFGARGYSQPRIEPFGLERIEVLKGPASVLYGQATPGGLVNMVSKRPRNEEIREVELQYGTDNHRQAAFDFGGAVDELGDLTYRLVAVGRLADTQFDFVDEEKIYVAPSIGWNITDRTRLEIFGEYQQIESDGGGGAPALPVNGVLYTDAYPALSRSTFVGEPGYDHFRNDQSFAGYRFEHELAPDWTVRQNLRYGVVDVDTQRVQAFCSSLATCDPSALLRYAWAFPERSELLTVDTNVVGDFDLGITEHTLLLGFDHAREDSSFEESQLQYILTPFDAYNPEFGATQISRPPAGMLIDQTSEQTGLYAQDQIGIGNFDLSFGGRYDWASSTTDTWRSPATTTRAEQDDEAFTGRLGAVYHFANGISPYIGYSTSFEPESGTDRFGTPFDPTEGEQLEGGVKYEPTAFRGTFTAALFELTQQNVLTPDPINTSFSEQTGEVRIRGLELEAKAEITEELTLVASYAYTDSEITKDNPDALGRTDEGNQLAFVPEHQASLWLDYALPAGTALDGLSLGGGVRHTGDFYGDNANTYDVPGYTLVDFAVRYDFGARHPEFEGLGAAVNLRNAFDETYVANCIGLTGCYWGTGREITATLSYKW